MVNNQPTANFNDLWDTSHFCRELVFEEAIQKKAAEMELGIKFVEEDKTFDRGCRGGR